MSEVQGKAALLVPMAPEQARTLSRGEAAGAKLSRLRIPAEDLRDPF